MRTDLTLDDDVARLIDEVVRREHHPMKQVVNDALRRALTPPAARRDEPYHLTPQASTVRPGFSLSGFNRLADALDDEATIAAARHAR